MLAGMNDGILVHAAQGGDAAAAGALIMRHRAGLLAVALRELQHPHDAEDAVQDATITALAHIGDLRDPQAAGAWLKTIVRNQCRMRRRTTQPVPVGDPAELAQAAKLIDGDPAQVVQDRATRDWIWNTLERLSPPLREVTLLRYFSRVTSYQDIATLCGVPVGTVRSRLHTAKAELSRRLEETAAQAHTDLRAGVAARRREAEHAFDAIASGAYSTVLRQTWKPTVQTVWGDGLRTRGYDRLINVMNGDYAHGVRHRLTQVVASRDILIWHTDITNPPHDPSHCPPESVWLLSLSDGLVSRFRLFHTPRPVALQQ
jgi:RNA polymerase sigma-70 factor (ECF subfamily)